MEKGSSPLRGSGELKHNEDGLSFREGEHLRRAMERKGSLRQPRLANIFTTILFRATVERLLDLSGFPRVVNPERGEVFRRSGVLREFLVQSDRGQ